MPRNNIYIWNNGAYDQSRWISLAHRGPESIVLHLTDLCQPGKLSGFGSATCPTEYLRSVVSGGGSLQITLDAGFLLVHRDDDLITLEVRGRDDVASIKAAFKAEDFAARISAQEDPSHLALTV